MSRVEEHKEKVKDLCFEFAEALKQRGLQHDDSKLNDEVERKGFEEFQSPPYGTEAYVKHLEDIKEIVFRHYKNNSHHPEHFEDGIRGMNLLDLVEMVMDWKSFGDADKYLETQVKRFNISSDLASIIKNSL